MVWVSVWFDVVWCENACGVVQYVMKISVD